MKRLPLILLVALTGALLITSCKSGDKSNTPVPVDALFVMHVNSGSLSSKLSWDEIKATTWFKEAYAEAPDSLLRKLLDNPDNSGIDSKADLMLFVKKQGRGGYFAFEGTLKDAAAFEAFNKKVNEGASTAKDADFNYIKLKDQGVVVWKDTRFIYVMDAPLGAVKSAMDRSGGYSEPFKFSPDSLRHFAKATFEISGKTSLGSDKRFADLMKEEGDMHFWVNNEEYFNLLGSSELSMLKVADLFKGNVSASTFNFENGKMIMKSKSYVNDEWAKLFKKNPPRKISADVINRIPSQNVIGVIAMNYPPEGLQELVKLTGLDGVANGFLGKANYSIEEFIKANKGDLLLSFSDLEMKTKEVVLPSYDGGEPTKFTTTSQDVKVLFATSVNDRPAFDKLIGTIVKEMGEQPEQMPKITYKLDNNWFVAGNNEEEVNKFMAGSKSNHGFAGKLTGQSFGMFVDLQKLLNGLNTGSKDSSDKAAFDISIKMWEDILVTGGDYKDGAMTSYAEVNLVDKNTNSLKQLNQYIDKLAGLYKNRYKFSPGTEDVMLPPPPAVDTEVKPAN